MTDTTYHLIMDTAHRGVHGYAEAQQKRQDFLLLMNAIRALPFRRDDDRVPPRPR